jgi:hypothetical protein
MMEFIIGDFNRWIHYVHINWPPIYMAHSEFIRFIVLQNWDNFIENLMKFLMKLATPLLVHVLFK